MNLLSPFPDLNPYAVLAVLVWTMFWKILALWRSAKGDQRYWFIAILVLNTLGVLEIIYLFRFAKDRLTLQDIKKGHFLP
jgi:hypothetical protein